MKIRLRGLILILVGVGAFYITYYFLAGSMYSTQSGHNQDAIKVAAWPLVLAVIGAIELVSGYAFYQVAQKWDAMPVLRRLLLGLVIIVASVPVIWLLLSSFLLH